jgi:tetratricopeptide (TPR) repeat protein
MLSWCPFPRCARGIFFLALCTALPAPAAPYRPADDAQVLERVPPRPPQTARGSSIEQAVARARAAIETARAEGDPRWLGYAEGLLQPWWQRPDPPAAVRLLRATILQSRHDFGAALADLAAIAADDPAYAQAQLTRATVLRVQGRYAEAARACAELVGRTDDFVATLCETAIKGLSGQLPAALADLAALESVAPTRPPGVRDWFAAEFAEALERNGHMPMAEQVYRAALARSADLGLRGAYADLLLAQGRSVEAVALLREDARSDWLALRLLRAQQATGTIDAALQLRIEEGFAAAERRGESPHLREQALYALHVLRQPVRALDLARRNWMTQREPADHLLFAQAAQAAQRPGALAPLREWLAQTQFQDERLRALLQAAP